MSLSAYDAANKANAYSADPLLGSYVISTRDTEMPNKEIALMLLTELESQDYLGSNLCRYYQVAYCHYPGYPNL